MIVKCSPGMEQLVKLFLLNVPTLGSTGITNCYSLGMNYLVHQVGHGNLEC